MAVFENGYEVGIRPAAMAQEEPIRVKNRVLEWLGKLIGPTPKGSGLRPSYVVSNEDWPPVQNTLPVDESYQVLVDIFEQGNDADYNAAMKDLKNTPLHGSSEH